MKPNLAQRAGRWSAAHWKTATFGWIAVVAVAAVLGMLAGTNKLTEAQQGTGETAIAQRILEDTGFQRPAGESVLIQSKSLTASDPRFRAAVASVTQRLELRSEVRNVRSPYHGGAAGAISKDGHSALVAFDMVGPADKAKDHVEPVLDSVAAAQQGNPGFTIAQFGPASAQHALDGTIGKDFQRAEQLSLPIIFAILLVAFGAFVAAGVPVMLGFSAVLGAIGISALISHAVPATDTTASVILAMGMAVGVDYALFYLKREREERVAGGENGVAVQRAAATSGQAVLISGATVMIAMAGMILAGSKVYTSIGLGAMIVVFVAMVGSVTVLPAVLAKLGVRVDRGLLAVLAAALARLGRPVGGQPRLLTRLKDRRTLLQRVKGERQESRLWGLVLRPAMRFPAATAIASAALLLVLALPVLGMHTRFSSFADLPKDMKIVQSYDAVRQAFPGAPAPAQVVIKARDVTSPRVQAGIDQLKQRALATGVMHEPIQTAISPDQTVARVAVPLAGDGSNTASTNALKVLRSQVIPATVGAVGRTQVAVTGEAAVTHDFNETMKAHAPLVFAFVLGLAFLLLLLTFRSIVIPLKAIMLNLLSVGAAYGVLVWIFQQGNLEGLLGFHSNGAVVAWLPLFLFVVLFGLSMDYHVFILSRIKELVDRGVPTERAVERGIRKTASTVTSAAVVMIAVFAIFASLSTLDMKQLGVGLAVAVLIDATIIRGLLLPATMKLLGAWNWYLPHWLQRLPHLNIAPEVHAPRPGGVPAPPPEQPPIAVANRERQPPGNIPALAPAATAPPIRRPALETGTRGRSPRAHERGDPPRHGHCRPPGR